MADNTIQNLPLVGERGGLDNRFDPTGTLSNLVDASRLQASTVRAPHIAPHQESIDLYLYGTSLPGEEHVVNKVQGMVQTFVELATSQPPMISLKCGTIMGGITQPNPADPMAPAMPMMVMDTLGESKILDTKILTDYFQSILDNKLQKLTRKGRNIALASAIFGWQDALYQWKNGKPELRVLPALQWYKDPTEEEIEDMRFVGVDWPMDAQAAKAQWPFMEEDIDRLASKTVTQTTMSAGYSSIYTDGPRAAPTVTPSIWWFRDHEQAMTDQEAIAAGLVQAQQEMPDVPDSASQDGDSGGAAGGANQGAGQLDGQGGSTLPSAAAPPPNASAAGQGGETIPAGNPAPTDGSAGQSGPGAAGQSDRGTQPPAAEPAIPPREMLILVATGEEVTPLSPDWPRKMVMRQCIQLGNRIAYDGVNAEWDIGIVSTFNVKVPNRPYGQGDPLRVRTLQRDYNSVHTDGVKHCKWFKGPTVFGDKSLQPDAAKGVKNLGLEPNKTYWVEMEGQTPLKDRIVVLDTPVMSPAILQVKNSLSEEFDAAAGRPAVLQGETPTPNASGIMVENLQQGAQSTASFRFQYLQDMWERVANLTWYSMDQNMQAEDYFRINRMYDVATIGQMITIKRQMDWEFEVKIGGDRKKAQDDANTRNDFAMHLIDQETACDHLGYDYQQIQQRQLASGMVPGALPPTGPGQLTGSGGPPDKAKSSLSGPPMRKPALAG